MSAQPINGGPVGVVFAGGGVRGAWSAGVAFGIVDVLGLRASDAPPFQIYAGTSVGSVNCGWMAAYSDRGDLGGEWTRSQWMRMRIEDHLRVDPRYLLTDPGPDRGRSLLDPRPIEELVCERPPWARLRRNLHEGVLRAVMLTATELHTGRSVWFTQRGWGGPIPDWRDQRRTIMEVELGGQHALGSSAIPVVFPVRRIGRAYYCDGGVRYKTPIAAALRAGARKLVVISLRNPHEHALGLDSPPAATPGVLETLMQALGALSYDSLPYDLKRLEAINRVVEIMEAELEPAQREHIEEAVAGKRGTSWRRVPTLTFTPETPFGQLALEHVEGLARRASPLSALLLRALARSGQADALSFLLFDRSFTEVLYAHGWAKAQARADEIRAFYAA